MKTLLKFIFLFSIPFTSFENVFPQIPSYTLQAKNFILSSDSKKVSFDIIITNNGAVQFEYAGGQYFFKLPQTFGDIGVGTGTNSGYQYDSINGSIVSDFPHEMISRNPSVVVTTINGVPSYELRLAFNLLGPTVILPEGVPLLFIKMKIKAREGILYPENLNLFFRDSCSDNPVPVLRTKLFAIVGAIYTEITRCANHTVDTSGLFASVICNIKLAIEGLYNSSNDKLLMRDTVTAYLRNVISPYQIVDSAKAVIDSITFTGNFNFIHTNIPAPYYIVVKHRNSIETWSKENGDSLTPGNNSYDFTTSSSQAFGNNMVLKGSKYCIYSGDVNQDFITDISDKSLIDNDVYNFITGYVLTDLNGDRVADIDDLVIADNNIYNYVLTVRP